VGPVTPHATACANSGPSRQSWHFERDPRGPLEIVAVDVEGQAWLALSEAVDDAKPQEMLRVLNQRWLRPSLGWRSSTALWDARRTMRADRRELRHDLVRRAPPRVCAREDVHRDWLSALPSNRRWRIVDNCAGSRGAGAK